MVDKDRFYEVIRKIPKAEIHIHLEDFFAAPGLPAKSLTEMLEAFRAGCASLVKVEDWNIAVDKLLGYLKKNGIVYAEVFFSIRIALERGMTYKSIVSLLKRRVRDIRANEGIDIKLIVDISRTNGVEHAEMILDHVLEHRSKEIIGIGLGGDEKLHETRLFVNMFERARKAGLRTVAHAGEDDTHQSVWDAVELLGAERVGHGTSGAYDQRTLELLVRKRIPLEIAPTSNLVTGRYVKNLAQHPIIKYWNSGALITLNTDDPTIFNTSLLKEYWKLYSVMGYEFNHLYTIVTNAFKASFLDEIKKREYIKTINSMWREVVSMKTDIRAFIEEKVAGLREQLRGKRVVCALSGGVDSAVTAALLHKAAPESLHCVFVNNGILRKGEPEDVMRVFKSELGMNLTMINAQDRFFNRLKGITDPEQKRKAIGDEFIRVFEDYAKAVGAVDFLAQGTIQSDVVESGIGAKLIKSHHNVGGLPDVMEFKEIIEPLRSLYKDEVRKVGMELGLPREIVVKQPFPGPALSIRVIGEVTRDKIEIVREADYIFREEIAKAGLGEKIWQYFAILTDNKSTGKDKEGARTYEWTVALRAVNSVEGISADWARIPFEVLEKASARITAEVAHVNRVVYDITTKPPATIEWE
ncbi:MAG: glutamine-hydrolyzing GMP synthase [Firmicutes bacterium]|nr:glutamine-hydrolyzing GMP synthase [Bacillota bacterium]